MKKFKMVDGHLFWVPEDGIPSIVTFKDRVVPIFEKYSNIQYGLIAMNWDKGWTSTKYDIFDAEIDSPLTHIDSSRMFVKIPDEDREMILFELTLNKEVEIDYPAT